MSYGLWSPWVQNGITCRQQKPAAWVRRVMALVLLLSTFQYLRQPMSAKSADVHFLYDQFGDEGQV